MRGSSALWPKHAEQQVLRTGVRVAQRARFLVCRENRLACVDVKTREHMLQLAIHRNAS
jgi:hypothetical protein